MVDDEVVEALRAAALEFIGVEVPARWALKEAMAARDEAMRVAAAGGLPNWRIGSPFGLSHQRVAEIVGPRRARGS
jgi:hypothetical protein